MSRRGSPRCLRCGAESAWIEGRVPPALPDEPAVSYEQCVEAMARAMHEAPTMRVEPLVPWEKLSDIGKAVWLYPARVSLEALRALGIAIPPKETT